MPRLERYDWVDFMRGIMMFMVILYHSEVYYGPGHSWSWVFEPFFLSGFFFISGYLFSRDKDLEIHFSSKLSQILRSIIFPYFFFTLAMALPKVLSGHGEINQLLIDIFLLRASWFVITLAVILLLFASYLRKRRTIIEIVIFTTILFILGYIIVLLYRLKPYWLMREPWLYSMAHPNCLPTCVNIAFVQSPFFLLGFLFRKYENIVTIQGNKMKTLISFLLYLAFVALDRTFIGSSCCVSIDGYTNIVLVFFYGIIGIVFLINFSKLVKKWMPINYLGKYSLLFYFLNGGALTIVSALIKKTALFNNTFYLNQILVTILAIVLIFPCVWFINKYIPILRGDKESFNRLSAKLGIKVRW